jgi:hypothetical protein
MKLLNPRNSQLGRIVALALALLLAPVLIGFLAFYLIVGVVLHIAIWLLWLIRGKDILLVYSDNPKWKEYVHSRLISRLSQRSVLLNWSERKNWNTFSLASLAFRYFGGSREFNPMVVLFRPLRWAKTFRFFKPLRQFNHGHPEELKRLERALFAATNDARVPKR